MPLITVIVPNFNHARFLPRRLDSIFNQTFNDFEVIILDDASTDNSREIIEQYRHHPKVKTIVYNEVNSGSPFLQWAKGLAMVETEWVWIAESDDYCEPGFLQALSPAFLRTDCVLAYAEINWVNDLGALIKAAPPAAPAWMQGPDFLRSHMLMHDHLVNAGMVVFRRACANHVAPGWLHMQQAGDYWFWCEIARQGIVFACGQSLAHFVRHRATSSGKHLYTKLHFDESIQVLRQMHQQGIFSDADIKRYLLEQLIGLETTRKAMTQSFFKENYQLWLSYATQFNLSIGENEVKRNALLRKARHWWKTKTNMSFQ